MLTAYLLAHLLREAHLLKESLVIPIRTLMGGALVIAATKNILRGKALEQRREKEEAGRALVRYVQLNRQCSEEVAYQRLASFVKKRVLLDDYSSIERMLTHERQSLLEIAQGLLVHDPDEIDEI